MGLLDDVTAKQGQTLTRQDCVTLFYNLLLADTKDGPVYGTTLGYTIKNNEVDYATVVSADTKGPYVASASRTLELPFSAASATVYRDGDLSSQSQVQQYDVYYYNFGLRTVWVYSDRATGTLTDLSPSKTAPTSATVAGVTYSIGSSTASYKLSSQGQFSQGDVVTVLLGMDGDIVDVVSAQNSETTYYGVVVASSKAASSSSTSSSSTTSAQAQTQVACSDGTVRTFYHSGGAQSVGKLVSVARHPVGHDPVRHLQAQPVRHGELRRHPLRRIQLCRRGGDFGHRRRRRLCPHLPLPPGGILPHR